MATTRAVSLPRHSKRSPTDGALSYAEEQLWLAERASPGAVPFFECAPSVSIVVQLAGPLNRAALENSLTEIVRRHHVLRSRFLVSHGRPARRFRRPSRIALTTLDLRRDPGEDRLAAARRVIAKSVNRRFDLDSGRLLRALLAALADDLHVLAITVHHIVFDRWSKRVLARELQQLYAAYAAGRAPDLEPLPAQYGDYVQWQRDRLESPFGRQLIEYWTAALSGLGELTLPLRGDCAPAASMRAGTWWFMVPPEDTSRLVAMSRRCRVTITSVLLAVLVLLLNRLSGREDIAVGVPLSDRRRPDFEQLIGLFMNVVVVRTTVTPLITFLELLERVRRAIVDACRYQDMPCGCLSTLVETPRPLYRIVFDFVPAIPASELELPALRVEPLEIDADRAALADLSLHVHHKAGTLACRLGYKADLVPAHWAGEFAAQFQSAVTAVLNAPHQRIGTLDLAAHVRPEGTSNERAPQWRGEPVLS